MAAWSDTESPVRVKYQPHLLAIILNRPRVLNTLNLQMIRLIHQALKEARAHDRVRLILLQGAGGQGFCAGGDLKALARAIQEKARPQAMAFFRQEYALDLFIHQFPKPLMVLAEGITMGGGLGLAAGADIVVATERTRMAMPETRIGFFPDVGATGWLFNKCPPGYPEYLALTGYEMLGGECVRLGLATFLIETTRLPELFEILGKISERLSLGKDEAVKQLQQALAPLADTAIPSKPQKDAWVATHFAGKATLQEIMASLSSCRMETGWCEEVFQRLSERSPTALALTLKLLRLNEGRPLPEVFAAEARAAEFMVQHPDYQEGIRARLIDKDDRPHWRPASLEEVEPLRVEF